ncbi:hypothetical protein MNV49_006183 [Pseudohyphozyma bogoriensis]|nr:hypothetical protein MNV49_006183 [Pseudohyphozyma bogoriensis]
MHGDDNSHDHEPIQVDTPPKHARPVVEHVEHEHENAEQQPPSTSRASEPVVGAEGKSRGRVGKVMLGLPKESTGSQLAPHPSHSHSPSIVSFTPPQYSTFEPANAQSLATNPLPPSATPTAPAPLYEPIAFETAVQWAQVPLPGLFQLSSLPPSGYFEHPFPSPDSPHSPPPPSAFYYPFAPFLPPPPPAGSPFPLPFPAFPLLPATAQYEDFYDPALDPSPPTQAPQVQPCSVFSCFASTFCILQPCGCRLCRDHLGTVIRGAQPDEGDEKRFDCVACGQMSWAFNPEKGGWAGWLEVPQTPNEPEHFYYEDDSGGSQTPSSPISLKSKPSGSTGAEVPIDESSPPSSSSSSGAEVVPERTLRRGKRTFSVQYLSKPGIIQKVKRSVSLDFGASHDGSHTSTGGYTCPQPPSSVPEAVTPRQRNQSSPPAPFCLQPPLHLSSSFPAEPISEPQATSQPTAPPPSFTSALQPLSPPFTPRAAYPPRTPSTNRTLKHFHSQPGMPSSPTPRIPRSASSTHFGPAPAFHRTSPTKPSLPPRPSNATLSSVPSVSSLGSLGSRAEQGGGPLSSASSTEGFVMRKPIVEDNRKWPIVKLENIPFTTTVQDVEEWLPIESLPAPEILPHAIHLILHRVTGRTLPHCYIEMLSEEKAADLIRTRDGGAFGDRKVRLKWERRNEMRRDYFICTVEQLFFQSDYFSVPAPSLAAAPIPCAPAMYFEPSAPLLTYFDFERIRELCYAQPPYYYRPIERPFLHLISLIMKFPWDKTELWTDEERDALFDCAFDALKTAILRIKEDCQFKQLTRKLGATLLSCSEFTDEQRGSVEVLSPAQYVDEETDEINTPTIKMIRCQPSITQQTFQTQSPPPSPCPHRFFPSGQPHSLSPRRSFGGHGPPFHRLGDKSSSESMSSFRLDAPTSRPRHPRFQSSAQSLKGLASGAAPATPPPSPRKKKSIALPTMDERRIVALDDVEDEGDVEM